MCLRQSHVAMHRRDHNIAGWWSAAAAAAASAGPQVRQPQSVLGFAIGQIVEAKYSEDSLNWKRAKVVALQPETDCLSLHFKGYRDHVEGVPRSRVRSIEGSG
eukprot:COSAG01_NODE_58348_length_306_cov_1.536232_1_plen_102_part_11